MPDTGRPFHGQGTQGRFQEPETGLCGRREQRLQLVDAGLRPRRTGPSGRDTREISTGSNNPT